jgi:hypothetical protein
MTPDTKVAIIGAGPYGLAAGAHLRRAGVDPLIFGDTMAFWRDRMPAGMLMRSAWEASHIADPHGTLTLDRYEAQLGRRLSRPVTLPEFIAYGQWFQRSAVPHIDPRRVRSVDRVGGRLRVELDDREVFEARHVVVAAGLDPFGNRPAPFDALPLELASHSSAHTDLVALARGRVLVVGAGQSALESAALLREHGADVEIVARAQEVHWLRGARLRSRLGPLRPLVYHWADVGPPGLNHLVSRPYVFRSFPLAWQARMARRSIRPAGADWLVPRLREVPMVLGSRVTSAEPAGGMARVTLDDGSYRDVHHVLTATGYSVDITRYGFLAPQLAAALEKRNGYPLLGPGLESSVAGLHFLGAPSAESFGPMMRFVSGTRFSARELTRRVMRR